LSQNKFTLFLLSAVAMTSQEYEYRTMYEKPKKAKVIPVRSEQANRITEARWTLGILYFMGLLFLVPQFFEKKIIRVDVEGKEYMFLTITEFGRSNIFRQFFHLWFYTLAVYIMPLLLILIFNFLLLRAFLTSQKKCQPYKMNKDPTQVLRNMSHIEPSALVTPEITSVRILSRQSSTESRTSELDGNTSNSNHNSTSFRLRQEGFKNCVKQNNAKISKRNRALTLTLFGVVILFGVCHLPAIMSRIVWVVQPRLEFNHSRNVFVSLFADVANFLVMLNSSVNFILYIVFGPGKFRQEFKNMCNSLFGCFVKCSKKVSAVLKRSGQRTKPQVELDPVSQSSEFQVNSMFKIERNHFFNDYIEEEENEAV